MCNYNKLLLSHPAWEAKSLAQRVAQVLTRIALDLETALNVRPEVNVPLDPQVRRQQSLYTGLVDATNVASLHRIDIEEILFN